MNIDKKIVNGVEYIIEKYDNTVRASVLSVKCKDKNINIESSIDGIPVTTIRRSAFAGSKIETITMPDCISYIHECAFEGSNIRNIKMPKGLISIGNFAFNNCRNLESIEFNDGLKHIGAYAFNKCIKLKDIETPENLKFLSTSAFSECSSLVSINLKGTSFEFMPGKDGFATTCPNLKNIYVNPRHPKYMSVNGVLYNDFTKELIRVPPALNLKKLTIPDWVRILERDSFEGVKSISTLIISRPKLGFLYGSKISTIQPLQIYCVPGSAVEEWANSCGINTAPYGSISKMSEFINTLTDENKVNDIN